MFAAADVDSNAVSLVVRIGTVDVLVLAPAPLAMAIGSLIALIARIDKQVIRK